MIFDNLRSKTTERPFSFEGISLLRYQFASNFIRNKKVLDIGTGLGHGAFFLAQKQIKNVLATDYSSLAIAYAKKHFHRPNLNYKIMDATKLFLLHELFDMVIAFEIIEHLPHEKHSFFIKNIKEQLSPKGICLISTPNKLFSSPNRKKPYNPYHAKEFTPKEFFQLCKKYFPEIKPLGIKCVNKEFIKKQTLIKKQLGNQLAHFLSRYKLTHELLPFIPQKIKRKITAEESLPPLKTSYFKIYSQNIETCENLLVLCTKRKSHLNFQSLPKYLRA